MSSADPRRPDKVVPFHMPPVTEDDPPDWNSNIAMVTGKRAIVGPLLATVSHAGLFPSSS